MNQESNACTAFNDNTQYQSAAPVSPARAELDVHMTAKHIYDMLLYHMHSTLGGFLINIVGLTIIILGGMRLYFGQATLWGAATYCAFGILLLAATPVSLKMRANNTMKQSKFQNTIHYGFDNSGVDETIGGGTNHYGWNQVEKAVSTPKTISFYMEGNDSVLVFPKESFDNETFQSAMWYLSHNVVMGKIYIH
ncbi:MAG: YcxB family protein [Clostridiales bacterium]|nr:YcxB family protein [Clostridiales bacterium]